MGMEGMEGMEGMGLFCLEEYSRMNGRDGCPGLEPVWKGKIGIWQIIS